LRLKVTWATVVDYTDNVPLIDVDGLETAALAL
jgi:hypothetical protein